MKHTKPYKHAVEKELKWLKKELEIIDDEFNSGRTDLALRLRRSWALNERDRLNMYAWEATAERRSKKQ